MAEMEMCEGVTKENENTIKTPRKGENDEKQRFTFLAWRSIYAAILPEM